MEDCIVDIDINQRHAHSIFLFFLDRLYAGSWSAPIEVQLISEAMAGSMAEVVGCMSALLLKI